MRAAPARFQPPPLRPGEEVPPFTAAGLGGESINVNYAGGGPRRVLLYFTPTCPFCRTQFEHWREILSRPEPGRVQVLGLSLPAR